MILVGVQRTEFADYIEQSDKVLKHLLLKDINSSPDPEASQPVDEPDYAFYTKNDLYAHIDFALTKFPEVPDRSMGWFHFIISNDTVQRKMELCMTYFKSASFNTYNDTLNLDPETDENCFYVQAEKFNSSYYFDIERILKDKALFQVIDRLFTIELHFSLKMIHLAKQISVWGADCLIHDGTILFNNEARTGKVAVSLRTLVSSFDCRGSYPGPMRKSLRNILIAVIVILLDLISIILCLISIKNSIRLLLDTRAYFAKQEKIKTESVKLRRKHKKEEKCLSLSDQVDLLKLWDIVFVINDVFTIAGTCVLLTMGHERLMEKYDEATTLLGLGGVLVWMGILRYFSFFPEFYLLFLIIKRAVWSVIRYLVCVVILFGGFVFCGWLVLGPYHRKFRTLESTAECLFAIMNGDELFDTFVGITRTTGYIWWFSRIYLYVFIGLFTTIALNLFIAICLDSYETIKMFCKEGFPPSVLMTFIQGTDNNDNSEDAPYFCTNGFVTDTVTYTEERPKTMIDHRRTVAFDGSHLRDDFKQREGSFQA